MLKVNLKKDIKIEGINIVKLNNKLQLTGFTWYGGSLITVTKYLKLKHLQNIKVIDIKNREDSCVVSIEINDIGVSQAIDTCVGFQRLINKERINILEELSCIPNVKE